jgi:hypothetical protein
MHGVSDLTSKMNGSVWPPTDELLAGGITTARGVPLVAAPRPASSFDLVV